MKGEIGEAMNAKEVDLMQKALKIPRRPYAPFFVYPGDRRKAEVGTVCCWLFSRYGNPTGRFDIQPCDNDPPDAVVIDLTDNKRWGVEVTELVNQNSIEQRCRGKKFVQNIWSEEQIESKIAKIIEGKTGKPFKNGPYDRKILLIHTDETFIAYGGGPRYLEQISISNRSSFDEIWVIAPPLPSMSPENDNAMICQIFKISQNNPTEPSTQIAGGDESSQPQL